MLAPSLPVSVAVLGLAALALEGGGAPAAGSPGPAPHAAPHATPPAPRSSSACQRGMQLVDGESCSEVQERCEKSWYNPANEKLVCERFASPRSCTGKQVNKRFCIDRYEWPNESGQRPEVMNNFYQAQVKCAALGKQLCTESEWTLACEGAELRPFPYGFVRDAQRCNGDQPWDKPDMSLVARRDAGELARLWQGVPSGSQPECRSTYGVYAVERLARFTVKDMQEKLELRARAACTCPPHDNLCRTMCGTLLGPGATDARPRPQKTR
jgi:sulfatase modifying factor 1